ncbi:MAG: hypothetical protein HY824_11645 [Acidobacteria bacterium]|nr:hypothetical protein [Acidobacteriota bacterium]
MSDIFQCGDNAALVGFLYGECEAAERAAIASHVAVCAACAAELAALEATRIQLASWTPPEVDLGFVISRPHAVAASGARRLAPAAWFIRPLPAWAQMVAAGMIFAAGLALGIARSSMDAERVLGGGDGRGTVPVDATGASASAQVSPGELAALERRLRGEIAQIRTAAARDAAPAPSGASAAVARGAQGDVEGPLMARVRALIDESEQRQQRELALRTTQIVRDFDSQRRVDLTQIQRNFGEIEGLTGAEAREQRQMLNYLMRVSQQR